MRGSGDLRQLHRHLQPVLVPEAERAGVRAHGADPRRTHGVCAPGQAGVEVLRWGQGRGQECAPENPGRYVDVFVVCAYCVCVCISLCRIKCDMNVYVRE